MTLPQLWHKKRSQRTMRRGFLKTFPNTVACQGWLEASFITEIPTNSLIPIMQKSKKLDNFLWMKKFIYP